MRGLGTNGLKRSVLTACDICFLKTITYIELQKSKSGLNFDRKILQIGQCASRHEQVKGRAELGTWGIFSFFQQ